MDAPEAVVAFAQTAGLVLSRVASMFISAPLFSQQQIPAEVRAGVSLGMTAILLFVVAPLAHPLPLATLLFCLTVQLVIGFLQGLVFAAVLAGAVAAGDLLDVSVGYSFAQSVDPTGDTSAHATISRLLQYVGVLAFLAMGGHLWIVGGMINGLHAAPITTTTLPVNLIETAVRELGNVLRAGFQMCVPVLAFMLLIDLVGAMMSRSVPQLQVMNVAFPIKVMAGVIALSWFAPVMVRVLGDALQRFYQLLSGGG
ncbi:MAG: hypothetical protein EB084_15995 [Proteobacteria bacterium]|nr:hypothetical protein [Pseudomonadota bacterium]